MPSPEGRRKPWPGLPNRLCLDRLVTSARTLVWGGNHHPPQTKTKQQKPDTPVASPCPWNREKTLSQWSAGSFKASATSAEPENRVSSPHSPSRLLPPVMGHFLMLFPLAVTLFPVPLPPAALSSVPCPVGPDPHQSCSRACSLLCSDNHVCALTSVGGQLCSILSPLKTGRVPQGRAQACLLLLLVSAHSRFSLNECVNDVTHESYLCV